MARINRIEKIDYRLFRKFSWPGGLAQFGRFNIIYGWNASGKTTLSSLFRAIEKRQALAQGTAEFIVDGKMYDLARISEDSPLPQVRVFNRDFIEANILTKQLQPIFYLGADSIAKQKKLESLREELASALRKQAAKDSELTAARNDIDSFCIQQAKLIKDLLSSSGGHNSYNNYNKGNFKSASMGFSDAAAVKAALLTPGQKSDLVQQKDARPREPLKDISLALPDLDLVTNEVVHLLSETVVSKVIHKLKKEPELAAWVQKGLSLHAQGVSNCGFCDQPLPPTRLNDLEGHFNDTYKHLVAKLDSTTARLRHFVKAAGDVQLPKKTELYENLRGSYEQRTTELKERLQHVVEYLFQLERAAMEKQERIFESVELKVSPPSTKGLTASIGAINELIRSHNAQTTDFERIVCDARASLEKSYIAEARPAFFEKEQAIQTAESELDGLRATVDALHSQISALELQIVEHRAPADELNAELASYLGRKDLKLQIGENGYTLTREGNAPENLSEGEKTAIAFLYFLKSLQDKSFDLSHSVVVIDDPVSSLDTNSLFSAFGFTKERTNKAGQLFVLTHNFGFFRQVKNWFHHLPKSDRPAGFYMLECRAVAGSRTASLRQLDALLREYDSEYHFLFKKVYEESCHESPVTDLQVYYALPNIARRLLEAFLAFRYPSLCGELNKQMEKIDFDAAKKARILRFLHVHSHDDRISDPGHDLSILSETPQVLRELIQLMSSEDPKHIEEMKEIVSPEPAVALAEA